MLKGTQFMTEKAGGSDVGAIETEAERIGVGADGVERWRLYGQKWFCTHADADVALMLARPRGAAPGTRGLGTVRPAAAARGRQPQQLPDRAAEGQARHALDGLGRDHPGRRDRLSGRRRRRGLQADDGAGQPVAAVSHGVRAAAMMRRCLNEAMAVARSRRAFGQAIIEYPLLRRQLMKIMLPTEQALSMYAFSADAMGRAERGRRGRRQPAAHPDAGLQVPRLPRQHPGRQPARSRCAAATATSRNG